MSGLDIFALIVLLSLLATAMAAVVMLGSWPGKVAEQRHHKHREAVKVGGWVTLFAGGVFWPLVLIWAYMDTNGHSSEKLSSQQHSGSTEDAREEAAS